MAILIQSVVMFGNAVGRSPYVWFEGKHHGNLNVVIVGQTGSGRKGTSLVRAKELFTADVDFCQRIVSGLSSGEGLIHAVRDASVKLNPEGKAEVIDAGVSDKRLLATETEFVQPLKLMKREGNILSPVIRDAFDQGELRTLTKHSSTSATNAHVSIIGHTTPDELKATLPLGDYHNGFANRFLWAYAERSQRLPYGGEHIDIRSFQKRLADALLKAKAFTEVKLILQR